MDNGTIKQLDRDINKEVNYMYAYPDNPTIRNPKIRLSFTGYAGRVAGFFLGGFMKTCSVEGCNRKHHARGYCEKHYHKWLKHADLLIDKEIHEKRESICIVEGCHNNHEAKGYCVKHYKKYLKYGNPLIEIIEMHGKSNISEYRTWTRMMQRCYDKKCTGYKNWGGRNIRMCDRWRNSFLAFYEDMGPKPFPKAQLDRINNDGNYEPENCRWTTHKVNSQNSRCAKLTIEKVQEIRKLYASNNYTLKMLGDIYNVNFGTISSIIRYKTWT